jgi:hypothetical protein
MTDDKQLSFSRPTWADVERSPDVDWPPHQSVTLSDLIAGARAVEGISLLGVT